MKLEVTSEAVAPVSYCTTAISPSTRSSSANSSVGFFLLLVLGTEANGLTLTSLSASGVLEAGPVFLGSLLHLPVMASMLQ